MKYSKKVFPGSSTEVYELLFERVKEETKNKHPDIQLQVKNAIGDMCESILRELKHAPLKSN